jgi:hypothetical protein
MELEKRWTCGRKGQLIKRSEKEWESLHFEADECICNIIVGFSLAMLCGSASAAAAAAAAAALAAESELAPPLVQHDFETDIWLCYMIVLGPPCGKTHFSTFSRRCCSRCRWESGE